MNDESEELSGEVIAELRSAIDASAEREADWESFHSRLNAAVAARLAVLSKLGETVAAGAAWWDYTARAGLAAVPIALAAGLLLFAYLRGGNESAPAPVARVAIVAPGSDAARAAFESVLTGVASRRVVIGTLLPAPSAAFLGDSSGGGAR